MAFFFAIRRATAAFEVGATDAAYALFARITADAVAPFRNIAAFASALDALLYDGTRAAGAAAPVRPANLALAFRNAGRIFTGESFGVANMVLRALGAVRALDAFPVQAKVVAFFRPTPDKAVAGADASAVRRIAKALFCPLSFAIALAGGSATTLLTHHSIRALNR